MKRIIFILSFSFILLSCNRELNLSSFQNSKDVIETTNEKPVIKGNRDIFYEIEDNKEIAITFETLIANTTAFDKEDGDITKNIKISVYDYYTKEEKKDSISLSDDYRYKMVYSITDSNGNTVNEVNYITIGDPANKLDENGNKIEIIHFEISKYLDESILPKEKQEEVIDYYYPSRRETYINNNPSTTHFAYIRYYFGNYNEVYVCYIEASYMYYQESSYEIVIEDLSFTFPTYHTFDIYYNRNFYDLEKAYEMNLLTYENVKEIYNKCIEYNVFVNKN